MEGRELGGQAISGPAYLHANAGMQLWAAGLKWCSERASTCAVCSHAFLACAWSLAQLGRRRGNHSGIMSPARACDAAWQARRARTARADDAGQHLNVLQIRVGVQRVAIPAQPVVLYAGVGERKVHLRAALPLLRGGPQSVSAMQGATMQHTDKLSDVLCRGQG